MSDKSQVVAGSQFLPENRLKDLVDHKDEKILSLESTIADRDAEIERLKEVAAVVISNDPEDHKPVCCGGSIQDMCGCMGATPSSIAEHELRQLVETTHD